jgi:glycosyltransferase involved in cell wall biosynthesis
MLKKILFIKFKSKSGIGIVSMNLLKNMKKVNYLTIELSLKNKLINNIYLKFFLSLLLEIIGSLKIHFKTIFKKEKYIFIFESTSIFSFILSLLTRKKIIIIVHDLMYLNGYKDQKSKIGKISIYLFYNFGRIYALKKSYKIIVISNKVKQDIEKLNLNIEIKKIYIGFDNIKFYQEKIKTKYKNYILNVGSESDRKNMKNIIKSFKLLKKDFPNLTLIKPGIINKNGRDKTLKYIKENNLIVGKDVIFINKYISEKELRRLYSNALFSIFPSFEEGFGLPIIESQACGCPVITTNYSPMNEICPYKELLVNPNSPKDIYKKSKKLLENEKYRQEKIKQGLKFSKNFTWKKTTEKLVKFLNKLK